MRADAASRLATFERQLDDAWEVHAELVRAQARNPQLRDNPQWKLIRMDAYETFHNLLAGYLRDR